MFLLLAGVAAAQWRVPPLSPFKHIANLFNLRVYRSFRHWFSPAIALYPAIIRDDEITFAAEIAFRGGDCISGDVLPGRR